MTPLELRQTDPRNEASRQGMRDAADLADGHPVPPYQGPYGYEYRRAFDWWRRALAPEHQPDLSHMGWGMISGGARNG